MKKFLKWIIVFGLLGAAAAVSLLYLEATSDPYFSHPAMTTERLGHHYFINDVVGISPVSGDDPKAYILSHSSRAAVLISHSGGALLVPADDYGLPQSENLPGWGAVDTLENPDATIAIQYFRTVLSGTVGKKTKLPGPGSIDISIPWQAVAHSFGDVDISVVWTGVRSDISVHISGPGSFWIETQPPPSDGFPIEFTLRDLDPAQVILGSNHLPAPAAGFSLTTRDLHSFASGELDGNPGLDFSVVRGGARGLVGELLPEATDILFDTESQSAVTEKYPGFRKNGCPGRQSGWVDIDNDRDLDLYVVCGRSGGTNSESPNQLFLFDGTDFREAAAEYRIDFEAHGAFRFIDWDGDLDQDLWWAPANGELVYFENNEHRFVEMYRRQKAWSGGSRQPQLLIRDFDADGQPDTLLTHPQGNFLVTGANGSFREVAPGMLNLPDSSYAATWSDVDRDGNLDLVTATLGIYFGRDNGLFANDEQHSLNRLFLADARLVSFATENGREFLFAYRRCLPSKLCGVRREFLSKLRRNAPLSVASLERLGLFEPYDWFLQIARETPDSAGVTPAAHTIVEFVLHGPLFNPRSLGAVVEFEDDSGQKRHWVGENESALYSQGDSTIYATLETARNYSARAIWQDGCEAVVEIAAFRAGKASSPVSLNRRLNVFRPLECAK